MPRRPTPLLLLLFVATIVGCGDSAPHDQTAERVASLEQGVRAFNRAAGVFTVWVGVDTVTTAAPDETITQAIGSHVALNTASCANAMISGTTASTDFGTSGCTLGTAALLVSGHVDAEVVRGGGYVTIRQTLATLVDGQMLTGRFEGSTTDGINFIYAGDLTMGATHVQGSNMVIGIANEGAQLNGFGKLDQPEGTVELAFDAIHQRFTGCYPDAGQANLETSPAAFTLEFADQTPQTGRASLLNDQTNSSTSTTLPARTGCPTGSMTS
jgi:hypothetical protein